MAMTSQVWIARPAVRRPGAPWSAVAVALATTLAACGTSPPIRYHAIEPLPVSSTAAPVTTPPGLVLQVGRVQVPAEMERQELMMEVAPGQLEVHESDHWAAPLPQLARRALAQDLSARMPPGTLAYPGAAWPVPTATLAVDILSFRIDGGSATMLLSWSLRRPLGTARPVAAAASAAARAAARSAEIVADAAAEPPVRGAQLQLATPAAGDGAAATAQAWGRLLALLSERVVADLGRVTAAAGESGPMLQATGR